MKMWCGNKYGEEARAERVCYEESRRDQKGGLTASAGDVVTILLNLPERGEEVGTGRSLTSD